MAFWSSAAEPKRQYRFKVVFGGLDGGATWYAKSVTKPSLEVSSVEHKYLGHTFNFPGSVTWQDVTLTLVDPVEPDAADGLFSILYEAGYDRPKDPSLSTETEPFRTIGKQEFLTGRTGDKGIKSVQIHQLNAAGDDLEVYKLHNPIITTVDFGDLDYGAEELSEIAITLKYDWAEVNPELKTHTGNQYFVSS